jgi:hypothetical protein
MWICSASFPGTHLEPQKFQDVPSSASYNPQDGENCISLSTISSLLPPSDRERLHQQALSKPIYVLLRWRPTQNPYPVFQTRHLITQDRGETTTSTTTTNPTVVFSQPLAWTQTIVRNHEEFAKVQEEATKQAAAQNPIARQTHFCRFCTRTPDCQHRRHHAQKRTLYERRALRQFRVELGVTTEDGSSSKQAHCHRLIEALRRHAEAVYKETGDTSELLRVTRLSQRLTESRINRAAGSRNGAVEGGGDARDA